MGWEVGGTSDLKCGYGRRIFGGLKFSIRGFFLSRKRWQVFFCKPLFYYSKQSKDS